MILDPFGYDRHGDIKGCNTTLEKNALNTRDVVLDRSSNRSADGGITQAGVQTP